MKSKKRGAIELSMTTIIVVIIGITLLTLGLRWVYSIFSNMEERQNQMSAAMDKQIKDLFGESDKPLNLLTTSIKAKQGELSKVGMAIKNTGGNNNQHFRYDIVVDQIPSGTNKNIVSSWFMYTKSEPNEYPIELNSGQLQTDVVGINLKGVSRSNSPIGVYRVTVKLTCREDNNLNSQEPLLIEVV